MLSMKTYMLVIIKIIKTTDVYIAGFVQCYKNICGMNEM